MIDEKKYLWFAVDLEVEIHITYSVGTHVTETKTYGATTTGSCGIHVQNYVYDTNKIVYCLILSTHDHHIGITILL